jgi:hypothetical protein
VLLIRFIISFFNIPLSCMQYLEIQILYIWKLEQLLKIFAKVNALSKRT